MSNPFQPESVPNGAELLDEARRLLTTYCALPSPEAADAVTLWCAATHALPALPFAPRLSVRSATKRSGKSRVLDVVTALSHTPLKTVNATVAAIFRSLGDEHPPTLVFDEVDTLFGSAKVAEQNEDLRGLLNAGFDRDNPSIRCVGPQQIPTEFPSFAMAALAGIGALPDTIEDRSVIIHMRRRKQSETVKPYRTRRDKPALEAVGAQLATWLGTAEAREALEAGQPESELEDRAADVWESLLLVADLAGGNWPQRARNAATKLCEAADDEHETSLGVQLLHDIRDVFTDWIKGEEGFVPTDILLQHLKGIDGSPWSDMDLTAHRLGRELKEFSIRSSRDAAGKKRGYKRDHFVDAWERYPKPADNPSKASESVKTQDDQGKPADTSTDTYGNNDKASDQASGRFSRSTPTLTLSDTSDATPAPNGSCQSPDCRKPGVPTGAGSTHHPGCPAPVERGAA